MTLPRIGRRILVPVNADTPFLLMGRPWDGYGDAIQAARYVPDVVGRFGAFIVVTSSSLARLFGGFGLPVRACDGHSGNLDRFGFECLTGPGSVIEEVEQREPGRGVFHLTIATSQKRQPCYRGRLIHIRAGLETVWHHVPPVARLWADPTIRHSYRVGLCSSGLGAAKDYRGIPGDALAPLLAASDGWLALHTSDPRFTQDDRSAALDLPGLASLGARDWADTAGIIQQLELVITTDTAVAHLAGTLGVPTFVLLIKDHDALWGQDETTPLYPSVRIYRQADEGDWTPVIDSVRAALEQRIAARQAA